MYKYREIQLNDADWEEKLSKLTKFEEDFAYPIKCSGKFINQTLTPTINIHGYSAEKDTILKNTLTFISENFNTIYENTLNAVVKKFKDWDIYDNQNNEDYNVTTIEDVDKMRDNGNFINTIIIDCDDSEEGFAHYSFNLRFDCSRFGFDDGLEVVMDKDKVVFWADGNTMEYIFTYKEILAQRGW